jgi:hypothetical protein
VTRKSRTMAWTLINVVNCFCMFFQGLIAFGAAQVLFAKRLESLAGPRKLCTTALALRGRPRNFSEGFVWAIMIYE